jgi:hypothetical protein
LEEAASHAALALIVGRSIAISFPQVTLVNYSTVVNNSLVNRSIAVSSSLTSHSIAVNSCSISYFISIMGSSIIFSSSNSVPAGYRPVSS